MKVKQIKRIAKNVIYFISFYLGIFNLALRILERFRKNHPCLILLYHRIVDDNTKYLDKGPGMHHHIRDFEKEISFLKKRYQVLPMDEVVAQIKSGKAFAKPTVALTFDDGYRDNFALAYPILRKYDMPATVYVTTSLIGTDERTWTDQIEWALMHTQQEYFLMPDLFGKERIPIKTTAEKRSACIDLAAKLKSIPDMRRKELLLAIFNILEVNSRSFSEGNSRMMLNWDEVREMGRNGISFGSHSHTHPILSRMPVPEAKKDILISKMTMEDKLDRKIMHFAYPNGNAEDFSQELTAFCMEIGFESVSTVIHGVNGCREKQTMSLKRIPSTRPIELFSAALFFRFLRNNN